MDASPGRFAMGDIRLKLRGLVAAVSLASVLIFMWFCFLFREPEASLAVLFGTAGLLGLVMTAVNVVVMERLGKGFFHNFAALQKKEGELKKALSSLGKAPLAFFVAFAIHFAVYVLVFFPLAKMDGLRTDIFVQLFFFLQSFGFLFAAFLYAFAENLASKTLLAQGLDRHPAGLGANRQKQKNILNTSLLVGIAIVFNLTLSFLGMRITDYEGAADTRMNMLFIVVTAGLFFCIIEAQVLVWARNNSTAFKRIIGQLDSLTSSDRDLTRRVNISSVDEFAIIAGQVNAFCETLSADIGILKEAQAELSEFGNTLGANAAESAAAVGQISANIDNIRQKQDGQSAGVIESSSAVQQIAKNIESLNQLIGQQASAVTQSSASIEQMISNINSISSSVGRMAGMFEELSASAETGSRNQTQTRLSVEKIIERAESLKSANAVIAKIASQTNLLAMNAAIEAAHAGEAGLGFSVVADEIRTLAETSTRETKNIKQELAQVSAAVAEVVDASKASAQSFSQVAEKIQTTDELVQSIRQAMSEQQEGAGQVMEALKNMNDITAQVRLGSQEMHTGNSMVLDEMNRLQTSTIEVKNSVDEIASGSAEVADGSRTVSTIAENTRKTISRMDEVIRVFKI